MKLIVCVGSSCHLKGSQQVIEQLCRLIEGAGLQAQVQLTGALCMEQCQNGVCVRWNSQCYSLTPDTTQAFFQTEVAARLR